MKRNLLIALLLFGVAIIAGAEGTNAPVKTTERLQNIIKRADASGTNALAQTNSVSAAAKHGQFQQRLVRIVRKETNQPPQAPASKP